MSFGGSSQKTTGSTTSEPWKASQPYLTANLKAASEVAPTQVYGGDRVAAQSGNTTAGMGGLAALAKGNMGGQGLSGQLQGVINSGGYNAAQQNAMDNTRQVANSQFDLNSDPGWAQIRDATISGVNLGSSGMGRTGSGTNQQLLTSGLADAGARQYNDWQSRRDAANASMFNMGQTGFGNLGAAYTGLQAPSETLMGVGAQQDAYKQSLINAGIDKFDEQQNAKRNDIAWKQGIFSGAGQLGGTSTTKAPGQSNLMSGLGYGLAGAGLLGGFF